MKSYLIWLSATIIGAAAGYGLSWLAGLNIYLCIGIGAILGSSAGITSNIHRERGVEVPVPEIKKDEQSSESEMADTSPDAKQKAS